MGLKEEILKKLAQCVVDMDEDGAEAVAKEAIEAGISPEEAILNGLSKGMERVGELFKEEEYFIPEVVVCADAMYAGIKVLRPYNIKSTQSKGKVVIGVVEGDTHDIGKNIVIIMLDAAGYEIHDLGRNVDLKEFVDKAIEVDADIICMSSLMTTTMDGMKTVIEDLNSRKLQHRPMVMVGGAPISPTFTESIGADGYSSNAADAVKLADRLMDKINHMEREDGFNGAFRIYK